MINSNICPNSATLWCAICFESDLEFDHSRSLKVKCDDIIALYAFLLMFNGNIWPNSTPLQDIRLRNLSDLEFDLSRSFNVKCESVIGLQRPKVPLKCYITTHESQISLRFAICYLGLVGS